MLTCLSGPSLKQMKILINGFSNFVTPKIQIFNQPLMCLRKSTLRAISSLFRPDLEENVSREFRAINLQRKDRTTTPKQMHGKRHIRMIMKRKLLFSSLQCVQCHTINRTRIGAKGPNLTSLVCTSLAASWMK